MPKSFRKLSGLHYNSGVIKQSRPVMYHSQEFERRLLIISVYWMYTAVKKEETLKANYKSHKSLQKPWINPEIIPNIKKKRAYYILQKQNKIPRNFFVQFRNCVTNHLRNSKRQFFKYEFDQYKKDAKTLGKLLTTY